MLSILACLVSVHWCVIWNWHVETRHAGFNITVRQIISNKTVTSDSSTDTIWHWLLCGTFCLELVEETDKCVLNCLHLKFKGPMIVTAADRRVSYLCKIGPQVESSNKQKGNKNSTLEDVDTSSWKKEICWTSLGWFLCHDI